MRGSKDHHLGKSMMGEYWESMWVCFGAVAFTQPSQGTAPLQRSLRSPSITH